MSLRRSRERRHTIGLTAVWGATLKDNEVGPAIYADFLPAALTHGRYRAAPDPLVVGHGLQRIPAAMDRLETASPHRRSSSQSDRSDGGQPRPLRERLRIYRSARTSVPPIRLSEDRPVGHPNREDQGGA